MARSYSSKYSREIAAAGFGSDWEPAKLNLRGMRRMDICVARVQVDQGVVGIAGAVFGSNNSVGAVVTAFPQNLETPQFLATVSALVPAAGRELTGLAELGRSGCRLFTGDDNQGRLSLRKLLPDQQGRDFEKRNALISRRKPTSSPPVLKVSRSADERVQACSRMREEKWNEQDNAARICARGSPSPVRV
jgi:hypothetical protein